MIRIIKIMLAKLVASDERCVIDQAEYRRRAEADLQSLRERQRVLELNDRRTALQVGAWARATVTEKKRAALPPRMPKAVVAWLPGLTADEVTTLARESTATIALHIASAPKSRIAGVRGVRPLRPCALTFPRPIPPAADMRDRVGTGGGPKGWGR